jgi:hypothetical protein
MQENNNLPPQPLLPDSISRQIKDTNSLDFKDFVSLSAVQKIEVRRLGEIGKQIYETYQKREKEQRLRSNIAVGSLISPELFPVGFAKIQAALERLYQDNTNDTEHKTILALFEFAADWGWVDSKTTIDSVDEVDMRLVSVLSNAYQKTMATLGAEEKIAFEENIVWYFKFNEHKYKAYVEKSKLVFSDRQQKNLAYDQYQAQEEQRKKLAFVEFLKLSPLQRLHVARRQGLQGIEDYISFTQQERQMRPKANQIFDRLKFYTWMPLGSNDLTALLTQPFPQHISLTQMSDILGTYCFAMRHGLVNQDNQALVQKVLNTLKNKSMMTKFENTFGNHAQRYDYLYEALKKDDPRWADPDGEYNQEAMRFFQLNERKLTNLFNRWLQSS